MNGRAWKKALKYLSLSAALGLSAVLVIVLLWNNSLNRPLPLEESITVQIAPGSSLQGIARQLAADDQLHAPQSLVWRGRLTGQAEAIQSGEYRLRPGMTPMDLLALLVSGRTVQHPVTLVEGWTLRQVLEYLWRNEVIENTLQDLTHEAIGERLDLAYPAPEGALFPDTYFVTRGASDLTVLRRAARRLETVLEEEWQQRDLALPYETPYEALIMASIVQKESGYAPEKPSIAGVFVRRLRQGMRLQSDPTVIYGMMGDYDGVIRRSDLNTTTAYNTYRIDGLPPTPIALAGRDAIRASLQPADDEPYLYFVSRGDGSHHFSETLAEHNAAVQRYLRGDRNDTDTAEPEQ